MKNTADVECQLLGKNVFSKIPVKKHGEKINLVPNASLSKFDSSNSKGWAGFGQHKVKLYTNTHNSYWMLNMDTEEKKHFIQQQKNNTYQIYF